jgi:Ca2+-binding EF-hand superfamily protein
LGGNSIGIEDEEWDKIVDEVDENGDGEISF